MTQYFGVFDIDGFPQGFYTDRDHGLDNIPQNAVPIPESVYRELLRFQGARAYRNGQVIPATPTPPPPIPPVDIVTQRLVDDPFLNALVSVIEDRTPAAPQSVKDGIIQKLTV